MSYPPTPVLMRCAVRRLPPGLRAEVAGVAVAPTMRLPLHGAAAVTFMYFGLDQLAAQHPMSRHVRHVHNENRLNSDNLQHHAKWRGACWRREWRKAPSEPTQGVVVAFLCVYIYIYIEREICIYTLYIYIYIVIRRGRERERY